MRRTYRLTLLFFFFTAALVAQPAANQQSSARKPKQYTIEQFMDTIKLGGASFSPDDKVIIFHSNQTGISNVFSLPVAGGTPKQVTHSTKESIFVIGFFPRDRRVLYTYDKGGNENDHIYLRGLDGVERDLTPGDKLKATFAGWAKDGKGFYFLTNERDPKFMDLYRMEAQGYTRKILFRNPGDFDVAAISHDEKWVALLKNNTTADTEIHLFNVASGEIKNSTPAKERETLYSAEDFDPEGKYL
ncbi:MAG: hypothetical protein L0Z53_11940, partial [Acidobacteriales bacterium]|nr:hypothetical protein [Terriglobales bacterium]